jgi:hypothetical protein
VHIDASLICANGSWDSLAERHVEDVLSENQTDEGAEVERKGRQSGQSGLRADAAKMLRVCPKTSGGITKFSEHEAD